jgi:PAS domain S-box-containing protein
MDLSAVRAVAELVPSLVWICDPDGSCRLVNARWARYTGRPAEEQLGQAWLDSVHAGDRAGFVASLRGDAELRCELRLLDASGEHRWFEVRAAPLRDAEGRVTAWFGTCNDIGQTFADIVAMSPGVLYAFRLAADGRMSMPFTSPASEEVLGLSPELLAREPEQLFRRIHADDSARLRASIATVAGTLKPWRGEFRYDHPTKGARWLEGHSRPRRQADGALLYYGVFQDVTHRHESEARYRRLYQAAPVAIWEQDWSEAFRRVDALGAGALDARPELLAELVATVVTVDGNDRARRIAGVPDGVPLAAVDAELRANPDVQRAFGAALLAYAGGADRFESEMSVATRGGGLRHVVVAGRFPPRRDPAGRVLLCVTDITARKQDERRLALQAAVGRVLSASRSLADAAPALIRALCEAEGWDYGAIWELDPELDRLGCVDLWHRHDVRALRLASRMRGMTLARGEGLAGRIWATGEAELVADLAQDPGFLLSAEAAAIGLRVAMAFPILFGERVLGVVYFLGRRQRLVDLPREVLEGIGRQIGSFLERVRAVDALQDSRRRFEVIAGATSDVLWDWNVGTGRVWWSEGLAALLGETSPPGPGVAWWMERIHPDDRARIVLRFDHAVTGEAHSWCDQYRFRRADGSFVAVQDRGQVMCDGAGRPLRMIGGIVAVG